MIIETRRVGSTVLPFRIKTSGCRGDVRLFRNPFRWGTLDIGGWFSRSIIECDPVWQRMRRNVPWSWRDVLISACHAPASPINPLSCYLLRRSIIAMRAVRCSDQIREKGEGSRDTFRKFQAGKMSESDSEFSVFTQRKGELWNSSR